MDLRGNRPRLIGEVLLWRNSGWNAHVTPCLCQIDPEAMHKQIFTLRDGCQLTTLYSGSSVSDAGVELELFIDHREELEARSQARGRFSQRLNHPLTKCSPQCRVVIFVNTKPSGIWRALADPI
jgi:hypothetical protein